MSSLYVLSFSLIGACVPDLWLSLQSVPNEDDKEGKKTKKLRQNFARSFLGIGKSYSLRIWYVHSHIFAAKWI